MNVVEKNIDEIIPYARNPRINVQSIDAVAASIKEFGWQQPIVIDSENIIIAGHTRFLAAKKLGMTKVPCQIVEGLSDAQKKAYRLLDNRVGHLTQWDKELLELELEELSDFDFTFFEADWETLLNDANLESTTTKPVTQNIAALETKYELIISCDDEGDLKNKYEKLTKEGYICRPLML